MFEKLLLDFINHFPLKVNSQNCINQENLKVCEKCLNSCPHGAISFENNRPVVDSSKCTVCGLCFSECPTNVFDIEIDLTKLYKRKGKLTLGCYLSEIEVDEKLPCLAILNEEILASLVFYGIPKVILDTSRCQNCPQKENYKFIKEYIERANLLLHYHRVEGKVEEYRPEEETEEEIPDAEAFLQELFGEETEEKTPKVSKKINVPLWRQLFFETVKNLKPENLCYQPVKEEKLRFAKPVFDNNKCQRSNVCSFWCPTRALSSDERGVYFTQILCTDCGLCEKICPNSAIILEKSFIPRRNVMAGRVVVGKGQKKVCKNCGREFIGSPDEELCLYCRKDKEMEKLIRDFLGF
jgi:Fe-S-cluster-containing hydrogenase component 2